MKDKILIQQIQSGRKELLNDVIEKYYDEVLHFCIYQVHDNTSAYDLTQETFYRFIRCVDTYQYRNLKAYLIRIARNLCIDYWNKKSDTLNICGLEDGGELSAGSKDAQFERIENGMVLADMLARLPAEQREVVVMRYYSDLKLADISRILNVNLSTVKSRLRLGVMALKKIGMQDVYIEEEESAREKRYRGC